MKRWYGWPDDVWAGLDDYERARKRVHWREHHLRKSLADHVRTKHFEAKNKK